MGYYVNPPNSSKEEWLNENGLVISEAVVKNFTFTDSKYLPVCLVNNGPFTAAAIAFCPQERDEFVRDDGRSKKWYAIKREYLKPFLPKEYHTAP